MKLGDIIKIDGKDYVITFYVSDTQYSYAPHIVKEDTAEVAEKPKRGRKAQ